MNSVHLGYEIPSGNAVEIPIRNMVVTGQTQEAGKTTALEALIARSKMRAVTFLTKRGEGSFTGARRIAPYFREQADWQFVASILEASRGEKMKFERSWIIKASRGASSLADVHRNVRKALETARGVNEGVYTVLDAYLEVVVPVINATRWATSLKLEPGVNAVDLTDLPMEMQHLVIKSCLDWVLDRERETVVVIPEAWKFAPEGRGTPVKQAAIALIRQGSALKNYVWLDSQDIGGVDKEVLRSCPVWLLGVQRETNEVKRTLLNIPEGRPKLKSADISTLDLGQFYACWKTHAIKTYVQPTWRAPALAREVAMGVTGVFEVNDRPKPTKEPAVDRVEEALRAENEKLRSDNESLRQRVVELSKQVKDIVASHVELSTALAPRRDTIKELRRDSTAETGGITAVHEARHRVAGPDRSEHPGAGGIASIGREISRSKNRAVTAAYPPGVDTPPWENQIQYEEDRFNAYAIRLLNELPDVLLQILTTKPEIEVKVERRVITIDGTTLKGRIAKLITEKFFESGKSPSQIRYELKRTGPDANTANIGRACDDFVKDGFLTDEASGYVQVVGMLVNIVEG